MPMPQKPEPNSLFRRKVGQKLGLFKYKNGQPGTNRDWLVQ